MAAYLNCLLLYTQLHGTLRYFSLPLFNRVVEDFTYLLQELLEDISLLELQQLPRHRDSSKESSE